MGLVDFSLGEVGGLFTGIREAITGEKIKDPAVMAKVELQLQQLEEAARSGQLKINAVEAANPHLFVAGWRPWLGWVGGMAVAYQFLLYPLIIWVWVSLGHSVESAPPMVDSSELYPIILGMLGMGAMRSHDKKHKIETNKVGVK